MDFLYVFYYYLVISTKTSECKYSRGRNTDDYNGRRQVLRSAMRIDLYTRKHVQAHVFNRIANLRQEADV